MAIIHIENLFLRTIIGINDAEREKKQDVRINIWLEFNADKAAVSDNIEDTINYRTLTKKTIDLVENSSFYLLEKLCNEILQIALNSSDLVEWAKVKVEKPHAIRFADSVSITLEKRKLK